MRPLPGFGDRLFRHDRVIAANIARANFAGWTDRLIAGGLLIFALAMAHGWAGVQSWSVAAWAACAVGAGTGIATTRLLATRIAFHRFDGLLAADAVQRDRSRRYLLAWHGVAVTTLAAVTVIVRPALLIATLPAYGAGAVAARAAALLTSRGSVRRPVLGWRARYWLHRPAAGAAFALIMLLSLVPAHALEATGRLVVIGMETVLFATALTVVEPDVVRFEVASGRGPWRIVVARAHGLFAFAATAALVCSLVTGLVAAGIVLAASMAVGLLLAMRVCAYSVHGKRFGDILVSILAGVFALVAWWMILLLPFVIIAVLWQLQRRAAAKRWLLA